jgi:undecaprenyl-diphosphatase
MIPLALGRPELFLSVVGGAVALVLIAGRRVPALAHWAAGLGFVLVVLALAGGVDRRSGAAILVPDSGALAMAVTTGLLAVLVAPAVNERIRWAAYSGGLILVVLAGFARLYFGFASLAGLMIGWLLALTWVAGLGVAYRTHALGRELRAPAALLAATAYAVGLALTAAQASPPRQPEPEQAHVVMSPAQWRSGGWRRLPQQREDLLHTWAQPLNVQYAGILEVLGERLRAAGWEQREPTGARDLLRWLSPSLPLERLPVLSHVHDGRHETVTWTRMAGERRLVLRLWPTAIRIQREGPLWVGAVSEQVKEKRFGLLAFAVTTPEFASARDRLAHDIGIPRSSMHGQPVLLATSTIRSMAGEAPMLQGLARFPGQTQTSDPLRPGHPSAGSALAPTGDRQAALQGRFRKIQVAGKLLHLGVIELPVPLRVLCLRNTAHCQQ